MVDKYFSTILRQVYDQVNKLIKVNIQASSTLNVRTSGIHNAPSSCGQETVTTSSTEICAADSSLNEGTLIINMDDTNEFYLNVGAAAETAHFVVYPKMWVMVPSSQACYGIVDQSEYVLVAYLRI